MGVIFGSSKILFIVFEEIIDGFHLLSLALVFLTFSTTSTKVGGFLSSPFGFLSSEESEGGIYGPDGPGIFGGGEFFSLAFSVSILPVKRFCSAVISLGLPLPLISESQLLPRRV